MGGTTNSTTQANASPLQQLFAGSQGYQQTAIPQIKAPQYPTTTALTPAQAAQNTMAGMLARVPAPVAAPAASTEVQKRGDSWGSGRNR